MKLRNVLMLALCVLLVGCAAGGMEDVKKSGFLGDYTQLKSGGEGHAALLYVDPATDFSTYDKIMFDRITIMLSPDADYKGIDPAIFKELVDYYEKALIDAVKDEYQIVDKPAPGVLRVKVAITDVKPGKPVSNTLSTILPVGLVIAGATKAGSGDNLGTGEAASEMAIVDAVSGKRLVAAVDRRQGGKMVFRGKWEDTRQAFDHWAQNFRNGLDALRKGEKL